jgi:hypothetical protein
MHLIPLGQAARSGARRRFALHAINLIGTASEQQMRSRQAAMLAIKRALRAVQGGCMPGYHLFLLDAANHIVGRQDIETGSDERAVMAAAELLARNVPSFPAAEIWQGTRKVRRIAGARRPTRTALGSSPPF